jgi:two-component system NtrC family sensor kinase
VKNKESKAASGGLSSGYGAVLAKDLEPDRRDTQEYFRRLRNKLRVSLLAAYLVPLAFLSLYYHFHFDMTLKMGGKVQLSSLAESQRNTVDLFLQERVVNIFSLFHESNFTSTPADDDMRRYLSRLRESSDAFVDVGFLDSRGVQIGYAGPYPFLSGREYSHEKWFKDLMEQQRNYYISDIYLGFRRKPHFTIAVRQVLDGEMCVMRATLDPDKLNLFLRTIGQGKGVASALVNTQGIYQVVDLDQGVLLGDSKYKFPMKPAAGVREMQGSAGTELVAYAWLSEAHWALVVRQPLNIAYASMYKARLVMIGLSAGMVVILVGAIWITTGRLLHRAESMESSRKELKSQLFHAAKLVSVGELAGGVAHEINNPLAIISSQSGVIRDMLNPEFGMDSSPEAIREELGIIDDAVLRAKDITYKLLNFVRRNESQTVACNVNRLLDDVVSGLMEREFEVADIRIVRDYAQDLPRVMLLPDQVRQVFLNIINNAGDAIGEAGTVTLTTREDDGFVRISITDTGNGMNQEEMARIFMPFFTTKEVGKGTGLGLSISLSIVESLGGKIDVQSVPGAGSSFTISFPHSEAEESKDVDGNEY